MKFVLLSDIHLSSKNPIARQDDLTVVQWEKMRFIWAYARKQDCIILQAGDLADSPRDFHVLAKLSELFTDNADPVKLIHVAGQHDMFLRSDTNETNVGVLNILSHHSQFVSLMLGFGRYWIGRPGNLEICVTGRGYNQPLSKFEYSSPTNILITHAPISKDKVKIDRKIINPKKFLADTKFDLILCGDIHRRFHIEYKGRHIINTGPILRRDADVYMMDFEPKFAVYDTETREIKWVKIPAKPSDEVLSRSHIEFTNELDKMTEQFSEKMKSSKPIKRTEFKENLTEFIKNNKVEKPVIKILEGYYARNI